MGVDEAQAPELERFDEARHTAFGVSLDGRVVADLTLIDVVTFDAGPRWESFSLVFDGPSPAPFCDGTFQVEHAELGSFPLFLVAICTDADGQQYEAVFNRRLALVSSSQEEP